MVEMALMELKDEMDVMEMTALMDRKAMKRWDDCPFLYRLF